MKSKTPKVLHKIGGRSLIHHVLSAARGLGCRNIHVVLGHERELIEAEIRSFAHEAGLPPLHVAVQAQARGTGDAVLSAWKSRPAEAQAQALPVIVLSGDAPLVDAEVIEGLLAKLERQGGRGMVVGSMRPPEAKGYGRLVLHEDGRVAKIVEEKEASPEERALKICNGGIYAFSSELLKNCLPRLKPSQRTQEVYITDLVAEANREGLPVGTVEFSAAKLEGVNDLSELARAEAALRMRTNAELMRSGVRLIDPATVYVDISVSVSPGALIEPNVLLLGDTQIGAGVVLETGVRLENTHVAANAHIKAHTIASGAEIGEGAVVGPMAQLRPGTRLGAKAKIGNFVELKQAVIGPRSKISHLSYLGDAKVGSDVNVGCGFITCNYDGVNKHQTNIGDAAFIGSDVQAVAPIDIAAGAYVASGTTLTRSVAAGDLAIARVRQENKAGYASRLLRKKQKRQTGDGSGQKDE